ncbi:HD domain-containing protein [Saccharothrix sp. NPDC042600]|uniref:HD domain-containing protein n=1 Tax=Saccharothrix TaxID=2071 RepID=UPI0034002767|nr:HDIG domain-containing protein [Saccharothrix mutabilis subsp. capreolus]
MAKWNDETSFFKASGNPFGLVDAVLLDQPDRRAHTSGVARRAKVFGRICSELDRVELYQAAVLHDVGYGVAVKDTGMHAIDGARFLKKAGFSSRVCALVAHHSFAALEAELRGLSEELGEWSDERTSVRDALWWADMTTGPSGEAMEVHDRMREIENRYGSGSLIANFIREAGPELIGAVERTEALLVAANLKVT